MKKVILLVALLSLGFFVEAKLDSKEQKTEAATTLVTPCE